MIVPIIVPPTYYKDMSNIFLSQIWHNVEQNLSHVDHIVFCGYLFPDADIHIKYLLKRAQTNRNTVLSFTVFNHHPNKDDKIAEEEQKRYERFLGKNINYTNKSFEDFATSCSFDHLF